ncbi:MAG: hypothetical protein N2645_01040 [Clostridia bacterium]|nr:hypothetical protein [Clostridia bacterium]
MKPAKGFSEEMTKKTPPFFVLEKPSSRPVSSFEAACDKDWNAGDSLQPLSKTGTYHKFRGTCFFLL